MGVCIGSICTRRSLRSYLLQFGKRPSLHESEVYRCTFKCVGIINLREIIFEKSGTCASSSINPAFYIHGIRGGD